MKIPVFHDDQHGTAIIAAAAFLNAIELTKRKIKKTRVPSCLATDHAIVRLFYTLKTTLRTKFAKAGSAIPGSY